MAIPKARFTYDTAGTPVTYTDLYDGPDKDSCVITLADLPAFSRWAVALENLDGSKNSSFTYLKEAKVEIDPGTGSWQKMIDGYVTGINKSYAAHQRKNIIIVRGISYGSFLFRKRKVNLDYRTFPKKARDAAIDAVSGLGMTTTNVQASATITEDTAKVFESRYVNDTLMELARSASCDIYPDEDRDLHMFKAYPDVNCPSTGKTFDDTSLKWLEHDEDVEEHFNKVTALGEDQISTSHINELAENTSYWIGTGFGTMTIVSGAPGTGAKAINLPAAAAASPVAIMGRYGDADQFNLLESDWHKFVFTIWYGLTGSRDAVLLRLIDTTSTDYWERTITADVPASTWKTLIYFLPSQNSTGWTTTGSPTKINRVEFVFQGSGTPSGSVKFQWCTFYRRLIKSSEVAYTLLLEKVAIDPTINVPGELQNLAAGELTRVKNADKVGILRVEGDVSLRRPGHTATLASTKLGISSGTIRIDEITHRISRKVYTTTIGFSNRSGQNFPSLREKLIQSGLIIREGVFPIQ